MSSKESIKIGNNRRIQMDTSFGILPRSWSRLVSLSTGCPQRLQAAIRNMEPAWLKVNGGNFPWLNIETKKDNFALAILSPRRSAFISPQSSTTRHVQSCCFSEVATSHPKHGTSMGESMSGKIFPHIPNHRIAILLAPPCLLPGSS